jgi:hypothetical protein
MLKRRIKQNLSHEERLMGDALARASQDTSNRLQAGHPAAEGAAGRDCRPRERVVELVRLKSTHVIGLRSSQRRANPAGNES